MARNRFGLIGRNISYSFSRTYFQDKFSELGLDDYSYENFDLPLIKDIEKVVLPYLGEIGGLNVTIPYKQEIMSYLDEIDPEAAEIGAVNVVKVLKGTKLRGYNTDVFGFEQSLRPGLRGHEKKALVLGTGGASKAVAFVLEKIGIEPLMVSRTPGENRFTYADLNESMMEQYQVVVNCTPLGTYPRVEEKPGIPYEGIGKRHILFDLIYNPEKTAFLLEGEKRGATVLNGRKMLEKQADKAWEIWNS